MELRNVVSVESYAYRNTVKIQRLRLAAEYIRTLRLGAVRVLPGFQACEDARLITSFVVKPIWAVVLSGSLRKEQMASPMVAKVWSRYLVAKIPMQMHLMALKTQIAENI